jgi:sodium-independent sulfate anion transporter 11
MITVFMDVETSIYVAVTLSLLLMLLRLARPSVNSLSQVSLSSKCIYVNEKDTHFKARTNPLPAGVVIIRPSHSILYPNAGYVSEKIISIVKSHTRSGSSKDLEQPWNQPKVEDIKQKEKPFLDAIVFDITAVDQLDVTAATTLRSLKSTLDRYAGKTVEYHFCGLANRQVRHVLIESGFGQLPPSIAGDFEITKNPNANNNEPLESMETVHSVRDPMNMTYYSAITIPEDGPLDLYSAFHWDVEAAIRAISKRRKPQLRSESSITMY